MENNRKYYSFLEIVDAKGKNSDYKHATVVGTLCNGEMRSTPDGKPVFGARLAISNRTKAINYALGTNFSESEETIWVSISFWEGRAEQIQRYMGDRKTVRVILCGSIKTNTYKDRNGVEQTGLSLTVSNWSGLGSGNGQGNGTQDNQSGSYQSSNSGNRQNSTPASVAETGGFTSLDDDDLEDGDLPF